MSPSEQIHTTPDNLSAHKTRAVLEFLQQHPRVRFHFTPTYSSWLNQVEIWFAKIEREVIARGIFTSVSDWLVNSDATSTHTLPMLGRSGGNTLTPPAASASPNREMDKKLFNTTGYNTADDIEKLLKTQELIQMQSQKKANLFYMLQ